MRLQAIANLYKNAVTVDETAGPFDKDGNPITIDENLVQQETERLEAEYQKTLYQRQRAPEYPSIGDQLDALFHAGVFPPEMAAQIQAVKDKYPKGS